MNEHDDETLYLDFYDSNERTLWCWKKGIYSSQEYLSEDAALEARNNGLLVFSSLDDEDFLGALHAAAEANENLKPPFDYWLVDESSVWESSANGLFLGEIPDFEIASGLNILKMSRRDLEFLQAEFELLQDASEAL
ncbi:hypothetical protein ACFL3W_01340 [Pseudomonadota bacterium]